MKTFNNSTWGKRHPVSGGGMLQVYPLPLFLFLSLLAFTAGCNDQGVESADLVLEPGLRVETVAAEPLVIDPVAYAYDELGYLYVVEDRGYPDPMGEDALPSTEGRIARLEDADGDGRYDRRTEFASGLTYPNGIMPWRGGVFVTVAPDVLYLKDTDGDGVADKEQVVLTGFKDTKTSQLRMSHPTLGFDGWVYLTSGLNGGEVYSPLHPERSPVTFSSSDVRFDPDSYEVEVVGGKSQFGMTFDRFGRRFGCSNRHPVQHIVFTPSDLNRNLHLSFNETVKNVSKTEAEAVVFPISGAATSADYIPDLMGQPHSGTFTAASGVFVYNGSGLTPDHQGDVFIAESAQNLVQRQNMHSDGVSFSSELVYEGKEFLASQNEWFRPVFLGIGPADGLHVVDMRRKVIDHPSYVPERVRDKLDFQAGKDSGRIYRIFGESKTHSLADKQWVSDSTPVSDITAWLTSDKQWNRETAHRLLLQRKDSTVIPRLRTIVKESPQPESRVRALWLLESLEGLDTDLLREAIADEEPGVRENAVRLSRGKLAQAKNLKEAVIGTCRDPNMRVRFHCALVLGDTKGAEATEALARVAAAGGDDRWMRAAVLSGIGHRMGSFLGHLQGRQSDTDDDAYAFLMEDVARILGSGGTKRELQRLAETVLGAEDKSRWRFSAMLGLLEGLVSRGGVNPSPNQLLTYVYGADVPGSVEASWGRFVDEVTARAQALQANQENRVTAIELLGFIAGSESLPVLADALRPEHRREVQLAVVRAIGRRNSREGARLLMDPERWAGYTPAVRSAVLSQMLSTPLFIDELLAAIEGGVVGPSEISSVDRKRLLDHRKKGIRQRAQTVFADLEGGARKEVYEEYLAAINDKGDPETGAAAFERACSACHTYAGQGGNVGPDLTGIKNQPKEAILLHTIMPNYEVYPSYQTVVIETNDGRSLSGWMVTETDNGVTLRTASGANETIMRENIASLTNTGASLMPDGLEQTMSKEEMAGLMEYLKSGAEY